MKKNNKVYSASDFAGMQSSIVIEDSWWTTDSIQVTKPGEFSRTPLFKIMLKAIAEGATDVPEGFVDSTSLLTKSRTYFVREGRPMYTELVDMWNDCDGEIDDFLDSAREMLAKRAFKGHVERLTGIHYTKETRSGESADRTKMELWYPIDHEPGTIVGDFLFMCNKHIYTPIIDTISNDPVADALKGVDPSVAAAIMAALGKK